MKKEMVNVGQSKDSRLQEELKYLQAFDGELMKQNDYEFMMSKFIDWLFWGFTVLGMLIPWGVGEDTRVMSFFVFIMGTMGIILSLAPYLNISRKKDNTGDSVYRLLRYMPISQKTIRKSRMQMLWKKNIRYGMGFLCAQLLSSIIRGRFTVATFLYPLFMTVVIAAVGVFYISGRNWSKTDRT